MKTSLLISTTIAAFAAATFMVVPISFAASAEEAVKHMEDKLKRKVAKDVDLQTTASVKSEKGFDARGVVMANAEITLGAGLAARIKNMPFKAGQGFKKGQELVAFDCARQAADLRGAQAALGKATSFYSGKKRLKARGAAGGQEVREAAADVASAKASVDALSEVISQCKIKAPFNGRVVERHADTFETPAANAPIMTVVDDSALELDLIVPSTWLRWVKKGTSFRFSVDELGETFEAKVDRMGAKVDAVSQTVKLTGSFVKRPGSVLAGMSGTAAFSPPVN